MDLVLVETQNLVPMPLGGSEGSGDAGGSWDSAKGYLGKGEK